MKTAKVRREIIGIHSHSPEGEPFIIDGILEQYAKKIAVKFLLENLNVEPITDRAIIIFYENVYDDWYANRTAK